MRHGKPARIVMGWAVFAFISAECFHINRFSDISVRCGVVSFYDTRRADLFQFSRISGAAPIPVETRLNAGGERLDLVGRKRPGVKPEIGETRGQEFICR